MYDNIQTVEITADVEASKSLGFWIKLVNNADLIIWDSGYVSVYNRKEWKGVDSGSCEMCLDFHALYT